MKKIAVLGLATFVLISCSRYASNGEHIYLQSKNGPELVVPRPLTELAVSHAYDLPTPGADANVSIAPPSKVETRTHTLQ